MPYSNYATKDKVGRDAAATRLRVTQLQVLVKFGSFDVQGK